MAGCGCGRKASGAATSSYVVVLPSGRQKSYSSQIAAQGEVARHPGAYIKNAQPVSA